MPLNFHRDRDASNSAWIGASMLGSLSTFYDLRIKRSDYEENGDSRISFLAKKSF
jgi:actin-related protein